MVKNKMLIVLILSIASVYAIIAWIAYVRRPLLCDDYVDYGLPFIGMWRAHPQFDGNNLVLTDQKRNIAIFVTSDGTGFVGDISPHRIKSGAELTVFNTRVSIPWTANRLYLARISHNA